MDHFYVALDKLIQEIKTRKAEKINNKFSFIWNPSTNDAESSVSKAIKLSEFYSGDLNAGDFSEETHQFSQCRYAIIWKSFNFRIAKQDLSEGTPEYLPSNLCCIEDFRYHSCVIC